MMKKHANKTQRMVAYYRALRKADKTKLTPQGCLIVSTLRTYHRPLTRAELIEALGKRLGKSCQQPTRVLSFYKKSLLASGFIEVRKKPYFLPKLKQSPRKVQKVRVLNVGSEALIGRSIVPPSIPVPVSSSPVPVPEPVLAPAVATPPEAPPVSSVVQPVGQLG